jgi:hypothetical protein
MSLLKAASAQRPILGDSGPLQWSKKAKTECPNPNGHSTILRRLPFCLPEVALGSAYSIGRIPLGLKATAARIFEIGCLPGLGRPPARSLSAGCQVPVSPRHRKGGLGQVVFETMSGPGNACLPPRGLSLFRVLWVDGGAQRPL